MVAAALARCEAEEETGGEEKGKTKLASTTAMAFRSLLSPPVLPPPSPAVAYSCLVSVHHGRRVRRPLEHGCRCDRPPERAPSSTSSSVGAGSYDREDAVRPVGLENGASHSDCQTGSVEPGYQATSAKGDTSRGDNEGWQKKLYHIDDFSQSRSKLQYFQAFGVDLSPDNVAVAVVYFVQGVLGLSRLAVSFYLKDDLNLDPAETAVVSGFSALPWLIKPLYGFISDSIPLFGYRRRSYLILSGLLGALSWSLMATVVDDKYSAALSIVLGSLAVAVSDVVLLVTGFNRELGTSDEWFTIGDSLIITVLGQASFMPVLVLAAKLCPPGVEATLFATLMSISNAGGVAGGLVGAGLTQLLESPEMILEI